MVDKGSRKRGMLAKVDRDYLQQGEEYGDSRQARHKRRQAVRERVYHSILDFPLLLDYLEEEEKERLWEEGLEDNPREFLDGLAATIGFIFWGTMSKEDAEAWVDHDVNPRSGLFMQTLKEALYQGGLKHDVVITDIDLNVEGDRLTEYSLEKVRERAEAGEDLSPQLVRLLLETETVNGDRVQEALREELTDDSLSDM